MSGYENSPLREITGGSLRPGGAHLTRQALALSAFPPGARLLDVGCGPGVSLSLLRERGYACLGLDLSRPFLQEARAHAPCVQGDFSRLPFAAGSFDGVLCECVLSLAADPAPALAECFRILRPGGRLLLSDLVARPPAGPPVDPRAGGPAGLLTPESLAGLLCSQRFTVLHMRDHTSLLRELAARIVWKFGSLAAFRQLCSGLEGLNGPCAGTDAKNLGYALIIAEKENNDETARHKRQPA